MFAQIVLQRSDELFAIPDDEPDMLHSVLSKLPSSLDVEVLISNTTELFEKYPPEGLKIWRSISSSSVLKTARWQDQIVNQSIDDGKVFFMRQVKELEWAAKREKMIKTLRVYRRPASAVGLAMLIGVISIWMKKSHVPSNVFGSLWRQWQGVFKGV